MCPYFCTNTGVFIHFPHLPENDTVLPLSASCYLPMYLHQNCIATLIEFSGSGMPVSVLCRDHEYTATYSSIVNLQMHREGKKRGMHKKNDQNCKFENGSADVHDIIKSFTKSHTVLQHVIIYKCMQKYSHIYFGNLVILS